MLVLPGVDIANTNMLVSKKKTHRPNVTPFLPKATPNLRDATLIYPK